MAATSQYTAAIVACRATSFGFTRPQPARRLFRNVDVTTVPFEPRVDKKVETTLVAVPDAEGKLRRPTRTSSSRRSPT